jgi:uncharacterized protein involved in response to NO
MQTTAPIPFLSLGLRPFYLGAAVFAAVSVPLWMWTWLGGVELPAGVSPFAWHVHEMLFGFAVAVIAGFLLTAARTWTGQPMPAGAELAGLFLLWVSARVSLLAGYQTLGMWLDLLFLPVLALRLALPLWRSRNHRNLFVVAVLLLLAAANALYHGAARGSLAAGFAPVAVAVAVDVLMLLMTVIGGRVIPAFSGNAIPGLNPRSWPTVEVASIGAVVAVIAIDASRPWLGTAMQPVLSPLLWLAAVALVLRLWGWRVWRTAPNPLLAILPLSYLWIPIHLTLRAWLGAEPGLVPSVAAHALTVGAMGGLMLGMMTRSALGHTGRPLRAGPLEIVCFIAVHAAAIARVAAPLSGSGRQSLWLLVSALLWSLAFATFALGYLPILTRRRADAVASGAPR